MTDEKILTDVRENANVAKKNMIEALNALEAAAEACKGDPIEDRINSVHDDLSNLKYDLFKGLDEWEALVREMIREAV